MIASARPVTRQHFEWFCSNFDVRKWTHNGFRARAICPNPGHDDHDPSLDIDFKDGEILMTCRARCPNEQILEAVDLTTADFWPSDEERFAPVSTPPKQYSGGGWGEVTGEWTYREPDGSMFGKVQRFDPMGEKKQYIPFHQNGKGLVRGKGNAPWPLYRSDELARIPRGGTVYLAAGEKCADAVASIGLNATAHQGGEGAWESHYADHLHTFEVVILEDNDAAGRKWGATVASDLHAKLIPCRIVRFPELPEKGDVYDWVTLGHSADELAALAAIAPAYQPSTEQLALAPPSAPRPGKPQLVDDALYGLAGDIVRAFDPHTEAHPAAVLASFIVFFGNCVGRSPEMWVGETRHGVNLAAVIVGATSRSRKGTSSAPIERIFKAVDETWLHTRRIDGIGSGEAIIWEVRDASEPKEIKGETVVEDQGVSDKRLMSHEPEFSSFLKVANREGSLAGEILRKSWDSPDMLRNMVKKSPVKASNPHISFLGHITAEEVRRELTETDQANGVGNRVLWVFAERSKLLATPTRLPEEPVLGLAGRVSAAVRFARQGGQTVWSDQASRLWREIYPDLSRDYPGMFGALTARAEAQVLRLSMLYALLDSSRSIEVDHLTAALAFWQYCEDSARHIFGDRIGDPVADRILDALRTSGELRESDIHELFGRHKRADAISRALQVLMTHGLARLDTEITKGRPARIWRLA